jgi:phosphopantothenoylcysteine decarboxylase/phosphopantothenate--cysteine ligase
MKRLRFVVTAGPTREHLDPVRFLSNPSTGKMGFAVARAAAARGHEVVLVAGPVSLKTPKGVRRVDVTSARDMLAAVERELLSPLPGLTDGALSKKAPRSPAIFVSTAAVADWRPAKCAARKLKKGQMSDTLKLVRNPDILKTVGRRLANSSSPSHPHPPTYLVGFAAETNDVIAEARRKCREKNLEMIVANDVTEKGAGFGTDTNRVTFLRRDGSVEKLPMMTKLAVARRIVRACEDFCP